MTYLTFLRFRLPSLKQTAACQWRSNRNSRPLQEDLGIFAGHEKNFAVELIMDGRLVMKNLEENHVSEKWLREELDKRNLKPEDVVYAVRGSNGRLFVDTYDDHITSPLDQE